MLKSMYGGLYMKVKIGISNNKNIGQMVNNTALMDYLSNMVGLNLAKPEVSRKLEVYATLIGARTKQLPNKIWTGFEQNISNMMQKLYSW